jgi:hypothetical protein
MPDNPAKGIVDWEKKLFSLGGLLKDNAPKTAETKPDTSYLDNAVKAANESYKEAAEKREAQQKDAKKKPMPRKR